MISEILPFSRSKCPYHTHPDAFPLFNRAVYWLLRRTIDADRTGRHAKVWKVDSGELSSAGQEILCCGRNICDMTATLQAELDREFPQSGGRSVVDAVIKPLAKERQTRRQVALVVDASSSMGWSVGGMASVSDAGTKMDWARKGMRSVLDELERDDFVSIISFDTSPEVHLKMTRWGDADRREIRKMVTEDDENAEIRAAGSTDIYDALVEARSQFADLSGAGTASRDIILLSDGQDDRDLKDFEELAAGMNTEGISISAGGIGQDYNEDVLLALTKNSSGKPAHITAGDDIQGFLEDRVREAGDTIATNPTLRVDLGDSFYANEDEGVVFSAPSNRTVPLSFDGGDVIIPFPDKLIAGQEHRLSFEVLGTPNQTGLTIPLAHLELCDDSDNTVATVRVEATYADKPNKKEHINKEREMAKIRAEMSAPDADKERIDDRIDDLEKQGWSGPAKKLRDDLNDTEGTGGKIKVSQDDEG